MNTEKYNPDFPELYNWTMLDSHKLSYLGMKLSGMIKHEFSLPVEKRVLGLGLRQALREIYAITGGE